MTLTLRSPAFEAGTPIPARFDHERGDLSPAPAWDGVPEGTAGLVLLVDDPDAPVQGSFVHWVLYNLDPARRGVAEGEVPAEAGAGANGFGRPGYLGSAPPPGDNRTTTYSGCSPWTSRSRWEGCPATRTSRRP
jgi:Raf kinase inhibitor-like YbhB/YbcL family protein